MPNVSIFFAIYPSRIWFTKASVAFDEKQMWLDRFDQGWGFPEIVDLEVNAFNKNTINGIVRFVLVERYFINN